MIEEIYWDPFDTALDANPYPVWKRMRDEAPVYRNDRFDFYALSRFADVEDCHRNHATYSSAFGTVLELMGPHMRNSGQMIFMDPPEHTVLRSLVARAFTPRRVSELEARIRRECVTLLDALAGRSTFDFVQDFGAQLPSCVISLLVGVPEEEREEQRQTIDRVFHIEPGVGMINDVSLNAIIAANEYLVGLIERRRADPQDDLVSALCVAEIVDDGELRRLSTSEVAAFTTLLYTAGTETVGRLLGNAAVLLAQHPSQREALVNDPALIPNAIEELLRFEAPSPVQGRTLTEDVVLHDVTVPAGSKVLLLTGSAGRDDRVYDDPDRFDVRRRFKHHLAFGHGIHFCVGAALARMEGRVALEETLRRYPTWDVDTDLVVRQHTSTVRGYSQVGVVVA